MAQSLNSFTGRIIYVIRRMPKQMEADFMNLLA